MRAGSPVAVRDIPAALPDVPINDFKEHRSSPPRQDAETDCSVNGHYTNMHPESSRRTGRFGEPSFD
jgi:hypothetical protein